MAEGSSRGGVPARGRTVLAGPAFRTLRSCAEPVGGAPRGPVRAGGTIGRTNVEMREYVRACRRRWPWLLLPVLAAIGIAAAVSLAGAPAYRSTTVLFVTTGASDPDAKASRLNSYIALLTGPRVADSVKSQLNLPLTRKEVQDSIAAQVQDGTDLLEVSATGLSADR